MESGKRTFQPNAINWSDLGLGNDALNRMKNRINANILIRNQKIGGKKAGPSQPPKNKVVVMAEISVIPRYSPTKNIPNFIPEYSE